ncbi:NAD-dependent succinate-semialdehyde dehydrogenase [Propionibacterium australiense]|uniref:Aldehyde dehydrogenase family n=1 Tax=Propionibacterium australiense TaxID=119981 RepID=A0A383S539_9ACTN|nr:NAD-dependent succinate-semialdehyde dehydrogenase [Propionibacterium australiense]RLP11159.1 aldehyde dehydrogenase family protein [Propionibacterium australiense]RLP12488.1 aldehyde dehydrogenase family protein [Propionibacterium australiense]SYZ32692.1 Aldehyde dehydrogenase family [Propionibacterium australiense]VEH91543.1 Succinate-semialdehyde dehydrogenase [NADP(+)] GabD [Propionibacterium australiense]
MTSYSVPADTPGTLIIGGAAVPGAAGTFEVTNPADGSVLAAIADADTAQGLAALDAAARAQDTWRRTAPRERAELLRAAFEEITRRRDDFALLMTLEMGKPLAESHGEVTYGAEFVRWFAEQAPRIAGRYASTPEGMLRQLITRRPVGPCLFITPWNFPLAMATRKIAPALAAGCTVVIRPASATPLTTLLFAKVLADVGLPDGVVNVITCRCHDVTDAIIADPRLRKLSFTGSSPVGQSLAAAAARNGLRVSMELGGNAPFIVFGDADVDAAVDGAVAAKMRNMGQACIAANRFIVHESCAPEFTEKLTARLSGLVCGDGAEPGTQVGPLISAADRDAIAGLVDRAIAAGARATCGARIPDLPGSYYQPTVLTGVAPDAEIMTTEIFGPVAPITTFRTEEQALAIANSVPAGLAGYVFTRDLDRIQRFADAMETGMIGANTGLLSNAAAPFGGVKQSGVGREGSFEGIEEYLETVYVALPDPWR